MSRVSTFAGSSFSPERILRSTTAPVSKFLNLVRVKAAPLPGFTNWNSMTVYGFPSISTLRPLRISDVSYMTRHVYLAPSRPVKPRFPCPPTRFRMELPQHLPCGPPWGISTAMDAAAHYRHLLTLGRDEFLASAAPAVLVRYRLRRPDLSVSGSKTLTFDQVLHETIDQSSADGGPPPE